MNGDGIAVVDFKQGYIASRAKGYVTSSRRNELPVVALR